MRIGILTFHNVTNYGALLQCFGVQELCKTIVPGAEVEVINYQPKSAVQYYLRRHLLQNRDFLYPFKMVSFKGFLNKHITLSRPLLADRDALKKVADRYDAIIVGSDEVWKINKIRGWDPSYFLDFANASKTRLISYAASSDLNTVYDDKADEIRGYLGRFHSIAVRDKHTRTNIERLISKPVVEVLDPTLVSDFAAITTPKRVHNRPYLLTYAKMEKGEMAVLRGWAQERGWDLVSIGHKNPLSSKTYMTQGPREWLNLIQNAELVVSNYYHGILLSIKYKKPLIPIYNKGKMAKIGDIAEKLEFSDKILSTLIGNEKTGFQSLCVDYSRTEVALEKRRTESLAYLRNALVHE